jgi:hypothetical protein
MNELHIRCNNSYRFVSDKTWPQNSFECITAATSIRCAREPREKARTVVVNGMKAKCSVCPFKPIWCQQKFAFPIINHKKRSLKSSHVLYLRHFVICTKCGNIKWSSALFCTVYIHTYMFLLYHCWFEYTLRKGCPLTEMSNRNISWG